MPLTITNECRRLRCETDWGFLAQNETAISMFGCGSENGNTFRGRGGYASQSYKKVMAC